MQEFSDTTDIPPVIVVERRHLPDRRDFWRGGRRNTDWMSRPIGAWRHLEQSLVAVAAVVRAADRPPGDPSMILRQVIGLGALTISAVVPLWTARAVLGVIVALLQPRESIVASAFRRTLTGRLKPAATAFFLQFRGERGRDLLGETASC